MITLEINNKEVRVKKGLTILQACQEIGIQIPRFCYHEKLSIAGNCRMCLVEVSKVVKPIASCALPVTENMKVFTETTIVKRAREGVLEFLLANHPLDCPICDQGGECDLQDQTMIYGNDRGRFYDYKRAVEDKNIGPLIKTVMTRCIHCTRCVRFLSEISNNNELGTTGRGGFMEIGTYIENRIIHSELSGNIIDLCPVGALTSKPYAFKARPWELKNIETIDIFDSFLSNIKVSIRGSEILRILPNISEYNQGWITDKIRFFYDSISYQRILQPAIKINNKFISLSWIQAYKKFYKIYLSQKWNINSFYGNNIDLQGLILFKELNNLLGASLIESINFSNNFMDFTKEEKNSSIYFDDTEFENYDLIVLIGVDLKQQNPLLNLQLKKNLKKKKLKIISFGLSSQDQNDFQSIGNTLESLIKFLEGRHKLSKLLIKAAQPLFLIAENLYFLKNINFFGFKYKNNVKIIFFASNSGILNAQELAININKFFIKNLFNYTKNNYMIFLYNTDEKKIIKNQNNFIIYQGHHGDINAIYADLIFPSLTFLEQKVSYLNYKGKIFDTNIIIKLNQLADWQIYHDLILIYKNLKNKLILNHDIIKNQNNFIKEINYFDNQNRYSLENIKNWLTYFSPVIIGEKSKYIFQLTNQLNIIKLKNILINNENDDYYMNDNLTRNSKIMSICSQKRKFIFDNFIN